MVAAIVAAELIISLVQSAPDAVIVRRVLLWGALGALLAVATHGLRDSIRRSQEATARLQERVGELMVVHDRDRLAADLQSGVVQRIFAAGLSLQSVLAMATQTEVRRRVAASVADLDDAIRLLRQAIFGLESRMAPEGLRHQVLRLCADVSPVPEITFAGPVDEALLPQDAEGLLGCCGPRSACWGRPAGRPPSASRPESGSASRWQEPADPAGRQRRREHPRLRSGARAGPPGWYRDRDRAGRERDQGRLERAAAPRALGRRSPADTAKDPDQRA